MCGNLLERHSFRIVSGDRSYAELYLSIKFPHRKIRWNYDNFLSVSFLSWRFRKILPLRKKIKFSIKDFSSKCDQIRRADLATFTGEILNGKLNFLCSVHDHRKAYWHIAWSWWSHEKLEEYTFIKFVHIQLIAWLWLFALEKLSVFNRNAGKCGENADQNNSEYGLFLRSIHIFWSN